MFQTFKHELNVEFLSKSWCVVSFNGKNSLNLKASSGNWALWGLMHGRSTLQLVICFKKGIVFWNVDSKKSLGVIALNHDVFIKLHCFRQSLWAVSNCEPLVLAFEWSLSIFDFGHEFTQFLLKLAKGYVAKNAFFAPVPQAICDFGRNVGEIHFGEVLTQTRKLHNLTRRQTIFYNTYSIYDILNHQFLLFLLFNWQFRILLFIILHAFNLFDFHG